MKLFGGLFLLPFLYMAPPILAELNEEEEISEPEPEKAPAVKIGARRKAAQEEDAEEPDHGKERELKKFLDRIEPELARKMELHKSGQLELGPKLNQQLDEWAGKLSTYKNLSEESLVERVKRVSVMIFALYDMGEKDKLKQAPEPNYQKSFSGSPASPAVSPSQPSRRVPVNTGDLGPLPVREIEERGVIFRGTRSELKALRRIWEKFLSEPENQKLWNKARAHKKFKKQILEFGVTRGKMARLEAAQGGDLLINFNGKLLYSDGYEAELIEDLKRAQKEALEKLGK